MNEEKVKYAVYEGEVRSRTDGQLHFISAQKLIKLYGVNPAECYTVPRRYKPGTDKAHIAWVDSLIPLHPRYSGDYSLPPEKK